MQINISNHYNWPRNNDIILSDNALSIMTITPELWYNFIGAVLAVRMKPFFSTYIKVTFEETDGTARKLVSSQSSSKPRQRHCMGTESTTE